MVRQLSIPICLWVFAAVAVAAHHVRADELQKPNILFILADDLAWSDLGCYGHPWHKTPHLDRLAADGIRMTDAYSPAPICSAARASILTGKTPARLHFEFVTKNESGRQELKPSQMLRTPPFTLDLPLEEVTIAEHLGDHGYETAFFGKWHLNAHHGSYLGWSPTHGPRQQGFQFAEEDFGSHPYSYRKSGPPNTIAQVGRFPHDAVTEKSVAFLQRSRGKPFFLMVSHFYVHTPVETPCNWLRERCEAEVPADVPNRKRRIRYAAFVETLDHYVGQLLIGLDESGLRDNTLVVFTSDNGGHPEYVANGPLRGSKWNLYEGGIRVPFLARWPRQIPAGAVCSAPVIGYDLLPTFAEVAGTPISSTQRHLDGQSLLGLLRDTSRRMDRNLYWHFPYYHPEAGFEQSLKQIGVNDFAVSQTRPQSAVRDGDRKLLHFFEDNRSELYLLSDDLGEQSDLSHQDPAGTARLERTLRQYLETTKARRPDLAESIGHPKS